MLSSKLQKSLSNSLAQPLYLPYNPKINSILHFKLNNFLKFPHHKKRNFLFKKGKARKF